ncbi:MAG: hypothetical protein Alis3KO_08170 [Aliiglaciecola sp.]
MNVRQVAFLFLLSIGLSFIGASVDAQQIQIKGPKNSSSQLSGSTYGPITPEDTLWRIANRYRQNKNLSVYQIMQAIYELNPDAFEDQNFNHLKDGAILKLPSERYIARIDAEQARLKAEQDDSSWQAFTKGETATVVSTPPSSVASKDDLTETKEVIEQKLTALDQEQNRQFMAIRQQFAESIDSVQSLLNENRKLVERLDTVDQEIGSLRGRVDEELQVQMDQMLALQNELLSISREAEAQRKAEMESDSFAWLTDPIFLIFLTVLMSISLLGGFAMWLIRRNKTSTDSSEPSHDEIHAAVLEQSDEMDDLADALTSELSEELDEDNDDDLFGDEDLLDDVLSDELEESLDTALDDEFESFDDLDDESLDPIIEEATDALDDDDGLLDQEDLDNLFDESDDDLLADIDSELDDLESTVSDDIGDLSGSDAELDSLLDEDASELLAESSDEETDGGIDISEEDLGASLDEELEQQTQELNVDEIMDSTSQPEPASDAGEAPVMAKAAIDDEPEKPEISIDELLEQPEPELPESIISEDPDLMNEEMLQNIDKEISSQNEQLDKVTDELLNEIKQLEQMGGMLEEDEDDQDVTENTDTSSADAEQQMDIQALDTLSEGLDDMLDDPVEGSLGEQSLDEIESLLENTPTVDSESQTATEQDEVNIDDILQSVEDSTAESEKEQDTGSQGEPEVGDAAEVVDEESALAADDIDALLEQESSSEDAASAESSDEQESELAVDNIDALLEQESPSEEPAATESGDQQEPELAIDDIDALLEQENIKDESISSVSADELLAELDNSLEGQSEQESAPEPDASEELESAGQLDVEDDLASDGDEPASSSDELADIPELDKALEEFEQEISSENNGFEESDSVEDLVSEAKGEVQLDEIIPDDSADDIEKVISELDDEIPSIGDLDSIASDHDDGFDDADLNEALRSFDESSLEEETGDSAAKQEDDVELEDLPGLGDWLSTSEAEETASIDELENTDFDELLESIDDVDDVAEKEAILEETGLDLDALLSETESEGASAEAQDNESDFLDVDDLINESIEAESDGDTERELNLDAALDSYAGIGEIQQVDVDGDNGVGAKLDLAQAYIETDNLDSAKEILEEILEKGDESQQAEAKELLEKLV